MSLKLINLVWESRATRKLAPSTKQVFVNIANSANDEGTAVGLKVERIQWQTNLGERTIRKAFRTLEAAGLITVTPRLGRVSIYQIHLDRLVDALDRRPARTAGTAS